MSDGFSALPLLPKDVKSRIRRRPSVTRKDISTWEVRQVIQGRGLSHEYVRSLFLPEGREFVCTEKEPGATVLSLRIKELPYRLTGRRRRGYHDAQEDE